MFINFGTLPSPNETKTSSPKGKILAKPETKDRKDFWRRKLWKTIASTSLDNQSISSFQLVTFTHFGVQFRVFYAHAGVILSRLKCGRVLKTSWHIFRHIVKVQRIQRPNKLLWTLIANMLSTNTSVNCDSLIFGKAVGNMGNLAEEIKEKRANLVRSCSQPLSWFLLQWRQPRGFVSGS